MIFLQLLCKVIRYKLRIVFAKYLKSKKGIAITIIFLAVITTASFLVWLIPQNNQTIFVVSDFELYLDEVKNIHSTIIQSLDDDFDELMNDNISSKEYAEKAKISSSQINAQIIKLIESNAPEKWHESYLNYIDSLKEYNSYIRETIVIANMIEDENESEVENILESANLFKQKSHEFVEASDNSRP